MPKVTFIPQNVSIEIPENVKILVAGTRAKVPIRFGCASCRCGTCAVQVSGDGQLSPMGDDERALLSRMQLVTDGTVRLACRAKVIAGETIVDLDFQDTYSPDQGEDGYDGEDDEEGQDD